MLKCTIQGHQVHSHCCASITSIHPQNASFCKIKTLLIKLPALGDHCLIPPFVMLFCCWLSFTYYEELSKGSLSKMFCKGAHTYRPDPGDNTKAELQWAHSSGQHWVTMYHEGQTLRRVEVLYPRMSFCVPFHQPKPVPPLFPPGLTQGKYDWKKSTILIYTSKYFSSCGIALL